MSSLNATPAGERVHIGLFGKRNAGKSSLINALTGQKLAVVADVPGTTTDPVLKAMELLPLGPVLMMDTAGIDDSGELGQLRVQKSLQVLNKTDIAILVIDSTAGITDEDLKMLQRIQDKELSCVVVFTKADVAEKNKANVSETTASKQFKPNETQEKAAREAKQNTMQDRSALEAEQNAMQGNAAPDAKINAIPSSIPLISVSSTTGKNIKELKELLAHLVPQKKAPFPICADLLKPEDQVLLVTPIDSAAPKGRLILPQQQTIRDIIDSDAVAVITKENHVGSALKNMKRPPAMVITDSQAFGKVNQAVPQEIKLTSFSILMARHKGNLEQAVLGVAALKQLQDGDRILISEGCTHHRQCGDIGTEKLPKWIQDFTGKHFNFSWTSGTEFPTDLSLYKLIIHCGGCMLNEREMQYRYRCAADTSSKSRPDDPVFHLQVWNTAELAGVVCNESDVPCKSLSSKLDVIRADGRPLLLKVTAYPSGNHRVINGKRDDVERRQEKRQLLSVLFSPVALFRTVFKFKNGDGRNQERRRIQGKQLFCQVRVNVFHKIDADIGIQ